MQKKRKKIRRKIIREYSSIDIFENEKASPDTQKIINFWYSQKLTTKSRKDTKTFKSAVTYLERRIKNYKTESGKQKFIKQAFDAISQYDKLLKENNLKKVPLSVFFIPPNIRYCKVPNYFNLIIKNKMEEYIKIEGTIKQRQFVAERLKWFYCKLVLGEDPNKHSFTQKQGRDFGIAARRLLKYMYKNKKLDFIDYEKGAKLDDFIRVLIKAIKWHYKRKVFYIAMLCSEYTFSEILPKFIHLRMR